MNASLKINILSSYISQIYVTLAGILILPMYLKYMGAEAYGLIGFFTLLQACFNLLDMGITPTVARETARFRGGAISALSYRRTLRVLQLIFSLIAVMAGGLLFALSNYIASNWLNVQNLSILSVESSLQLMAVGVALRWMSGFYRSCVTGTESIVWLSWFNIFIATLRFLGALPFVIWVSNTPEGFFLYQLIVSLVEFAGLRKKSLKQFPKTEADENIGWNLFILIRETKSALSFSLLLALTSSCWILVMQVDKMVLSKILTLTDFGYFSLAVLAASGVMMVSVPLSSVVLPRLVRLNSEKKEDDFLELYRKATKFVAMLAFPAAWIMVFFPEKVIYAWTGDSAAIKSSAHILSLYALGNVLLVMNAFPYYLQYAKGVIRLHVIGHIALVSFIVPAIIFTAPVMGAVGVGAVWLMTHFVYFLFWVPIVHKSLYPAVHFRWLFNDVLTPAALSFCAVWCMSLFSIWKSDRIQNVTVLLLIGCFALCVGSYKSAVIKIENKKLFFYIK